MMEIKGTLLKICKTENISLKDGNTIQKGGFVIMRSGNFPKPVYFEIFGEDRLMQLNGLTENMNLSVTFYAESREGRDGHYFTTLRCTNITILNQQPSDDHPLVHPPTDDGFSVNAPQMGDDEVLPF